ncbi:TPA: hypothetical protein ACG4X3_002959, partial [Enterococcus faecium]
GNYYLFLIPFLNLHTSSYLCPNLITQILKKNSVKPDSFLSLQQPTFSSDPFTRTCIQKLLNADTICGYLKKR